MSRRRAVKQDPTNDPTAPDPTTTTTAPNTSSSSSSSPVDDVSSVSKSLLLMYVTAGSFAVVVMLLLYDPTMLWGTAARSQQQLDCGPPDMEHFSEVPARGMHVLTLISGSCDGAETTKALSFELHVDGIANTGHTPGYSFLSVECLAGVGGGHLSSRIREVVEQRRPAQFEWLKRRLSRSAYGELTQRPGATRESADWVSFFTPVGQRLSGENGPFDADDDTRVRHALETCGVVYGFEGGSFMFPGVRIGHNITLQPPTSATKDATFGAITLTTLSLQPLIFTIDPLLTATVRTLHPWKDLPSSRDCHQSPVLSPDLTAHDAGRNVRRLSSSRSHSWFPRQSSGQTAIRASSSGRRLRRGLEQTQLSSGVWRRGLTNCCMYRKRMVNRCRCCGIDQARSTTRIMTVREEATIL